MLHREKGKHVKGNMYERFESQRTCARIYIYISPEAYFAVIIMSIISILEYQNTVGTDLLSILLPPLDTRTYIIFDIVAFCHLTLFVCSFGIFTYSSVF